MFGEDFPLGVIANNLDVDEGPDIQLFRPEHRHLDCEKVKKTGIGGRRCSKE